MTVDKGIAIRNIYHMLAYAFSELRQSHFERCAAEDFDDAQDLFAEILARGLSAQLKHGLHRAYVGHCSELSTLRGKLDIGATAAVRAKGLPRLVCRHDIFCENNSFNRIVKTTLTLLAAHSAVRPPRKAALRRLLPFFAGVDTIAPSGIRWDALRFDRNTRGYRMLIHLCRLVLENLIFSQSDEGRCAVYSLTDAQMSRLFEHFVLEYYRRHHPGLKPQARQLRWNIDEGESSAAGILPVMQTDIFLSRGERTLIIDTKYYGSSMNTRYDKARIHSANQYQIYSYVTNHDRNHSGLTDGMLLYARTSEEMQPAGQIRLTDGNTIYYRNLDLSVPFAEVCRQLDALVEGL